MKRQADSTKCSPNFVVNVVDIKYRGTLLTFGWVTLCFGSWHAWFLHGPFGCITFAELGSHAAFSSGLYLVLLKEDAWEMHDEIGGSLGVRAYKAVRRVTNICLVFCYIDALLIRTAAKYVPT